MSLEFMQQKSRAFIEASKHRCACGAGMSRLQTRWAVVNKTVCKGQLECLECSAIHSVREDTQANRALLVICAGNVRRRRTPQEIREGL